MKSQNVEKVVHKFYEGPGEYKATELWSVSRKVVRLTGISTKTRKAHLPNVSHVSSRTSNFVSIYVVIRNVTRIKDLWSKLINRFLMFRIDALYTCKTKPAFWKNMLPQSPKLKLHLES